MGTVLRIRLAAGSREAGVRAIEAAFRAVERADRLLSTWKSESALSRLNRSSPERAVSIPSGLAQLLVGLREWTGRTEGAFDPTVGALVDAWNLRGEGRRPRPEALRAAREASGWEHFEIETGRAEGIEARRSEVLEAGWSEARRLHPHAWIDAGAFGKGLALRWARDALVRQGVDSALLDFGGQVLVLGGPPGAGRCWRVGVAHPRQRQRVAEELPLCGGSGGPHRTGSGTGKSQTSSSAATTSASERFVTVDGDTLGHVLDPRSGRPVSPWGSVTVVRDDPLEADLLSTALFVMGPGDGREWARERGVAALLVEWEGEELSEWMSPALRELLADAEAGDRHPAGAGAGAAARWLGAYWLESDSRTPGSKTGSVVMDRTEVKVTDAIEHLMQAKGGGG